MMNDDDWWSRGGQNKNPRHYYTKTIGISIIQWSRIFVLVTLNDDDNSKWWWMMMIDDERGVESKIKWCWTFFSTNAYHILKIFENILKNLENFPIFSKYFSNFSKYCFIKNLRPLLYPNSIGISIGKRSWIFVSVALAFLGCPSRMPQGGSGHPRLSSLFSYDARNWMMCQDVWSIQLFPNLKNIWSI